MSIDHADGQTVQALASQDRASIPWKIGDIVAAFIFLAVAIIFTLAAVQLASSVRNGEGAEAKLAAGITVIVAISLVALTARFSRLRVVPALGTTAGASAIAAIISLTSGWSLESSDGDVLGVPGFVFFLALVEGLMLATALLYTRTKYNSSLQSLGFVRSHGLRPFVSALGYWSLALVAIGVWALSVTALGFDQFLFPDTAEESLTIAGGSIPIAILLVGIWGPIGEEVFFRGFLLRGLEHRFGIKLAILISSVVFGLVHVAPGAIFPTFFLGLAFAWIYVRTGSLWPSIFAHSVQNSLAIIVAAVKLGE